MEPIITVNEYPIGWEWLDKVPLESINWPDPDDQETFEKQLLG